MGLTAISAAVAHVCRGLRHARPRPALMGGIWYLRAGGPMLSLKVRMPGGPRG